MTRDFHFLGPGFINVSKLFIRRKVDQNDPGFLGFWGPFSGVKFINVSKLFLRRKVDQNDPGFLPP